MEKSLFFHLDMRSNRAHSTHAHMLPSYITYIFHKQFSLFPLLFLLISTFSFMLNVCVYERALDAHNGFVAIYIYI